MAFATSETSARVGLGFSIMELSIWVATMTGLPSLRQRATIRFCSMGTLSAASSTARSPRATMMPSDS